MMTRLLLIRHGETDWNQQFRHQGQKDIPLNGLGFEQANKVSQYLANEQIDAIYSSDLSRARETAEVIAEQHSEIVILQEHRLREMSFGEWEGLTYEEIQLRKQMTPYDWNRTMLNTGPPGGESLRQFADRIKSVTDEILEQHPHETVLVIAHSGTLMLMISLLLEHPIEKYWQFRINQASISEISTYPRGVIISKLNGTNHLIS